MKTRISLIAIAFALTLQSQGQSIDAPLLASLADTTTADNSANQFATIYVYRPLHFMGFVVDYNLHISNENGDQKIGRVEVNKAFEAQTNKIGNVKIWARTEARQSIATNLEPGKSYYLECGVGWGLLWGRPKFRLVNDQLGDLRFKRVSKQISRKQYRQQIKSQVALLQ